MRYAGIPVGRPRHLSAAGLLLALGLGLGVQPPPSSPCQGELSQRTFEFRCSQTLELTGSSDDRPGSPSSERDAIQADIAETRGLALLREVRARPDGEAWVQLVFSGGSECTSGRTVDLSQPEGGPFLLEVPDPADDDVQLAGRVLEWRPRDPQASLREDGRQMDDSSFALLASDERLAAALDALERLTRPGQRRTRVEPEVLAALLAPHAIASLEPRPRSPWVLDPPRMSDLLLGRLDGNCELLAEPVVASGSGAVRTYQLNGWIETAPSRDVEITSGQGTWSGSELRWRAAWLRTTRLRLSGEVQRKVDEPKGLSWQLRADVHCYCNQEVGVPMMAFELGMQWKGTWSSEGEVVPVPR